jgi:hypothetical protein
MTPMELMAGSTPGPVQSFPSQLICGILFHVHKLGFFFIVLGSKDAIFVLVS